MSTPKRILTVNVQPKEYPSEVITNNINYLSGNLDLTEDEAKEFVAGIPEYWNTDKDIMLKFVWYDDKTFFCQREKEFYNFSIRDADKKIYFFDVATPSQVDELVTYCAEFYTKIKIARIDNLYDEIVNNLKDFSYIKFALLETRDKFLKDTDYKMMPDYPLPEEEKEEWAKYRQELRDITSQEAWINNDFVNFEMPVSPEPKQQTFELLQELTTKIQYEQRNIPPDLLSSLKENVKGQGFENVVKKFTQMTLKVEVLRSISSMKLPFAIINENDLNTDNLIPKITTVFPDIENYEIDYPTQQALDIWSQYLVDIDAKIEAINAKLNEYNVNFTIGDIIKSVSDHTKQQIDEYENQQEIQGLLDDLEFEQHIEGDNTDGV